MTTTKGEITERENIRNVAGKRRFIRQMDRQIGPAGVFEQNGAFRVAGKMV